MLFFCNLALAQIDNPQIDNPKEDQWEKAGGDIVLKGKHEFKHSDPTIGIPKGAFTVRGPGFIGLFVKRIHNVNPGVGLKKLNEKGEPTGEGQSIQYLGDLKLLRGSSGWVWEGQSSIKDFVPSSNAGGWVPGPTKANPTATTTLQVWAMINPAVPPDRNDIAIEYEFWFFPLEGGKIVQAIEYGPNGEEIDVTPGKFVEPIPGKIMGGIDEPTLPPDIPITGNQDEVKDNPQYGKQFHAKSVYGDVQIDHGEFGLEPIKNWDIIRVGDVIVTGDNSRVTLINPVYPGSLYIEQNSRVKIVERKDIKSMSQRWQEFWQDTKKISSLIIRNFNDGLATESGRPLFCLDEGTTYFHDIPVSGVVADFLKYFIEPLPKHKEDIISTGPPVYSVLYTHDRGTMYKLTHNKSTGSKSVAVVEGEVIAVCDLQPETVWSVKAGEKLTIDTDCSGHKSNLTANEIQQITGVFPDDEETVSLPPIADNYVYAYSYSDWNMANWGKHDVLGAGWNPTGGESRAYLKFDLTGIDPDSINKATLKLYHFHTGGGNGIELGVYRVMSPWIEGNGTYNPSTRAASGELSWVNQPSVDQYPVVYFNPGPGINKWVEADVTSLIKAWLTGIPNHGMAIKGGEDYIGKTESQYAFRSREFEDVEIRPVLVLYKK